MTKWFKISAMQDDQPEAVTSAEFIRNFSHWRMKAASSPVIISNHGKNSHVLISYDRYLNGTENGTAKGNPLADAGLGLIDDLRECVLIVDDEARILTINRVACEFMRVRADDVLGRPLLDVFPMLADSYVWRNMVRTLRTGERYSGDSPSLLRDGAWLRLDILPVEVGAAFIFREVTEEIAAFQLADAKQAIIRAMELDGSIGYVRLSLREAIERADSVLIDLLGVTEQSITRVKFSALMPQSRRPAFTAALEAALAGEGGQKLASDLVGREGAAIPVNLSIVSLPGAHAPEGAIVVITRR